MVAAIPDLELGALDGIAGDTVYLADLQAGLEGIEEGDGRCLTSLQRYFLRNGAENDMVGDIDLRHFECADRDRVEEDAAMVIGRGAGRKAAVDLLDTVGHALDGLTIGDVLLDNFKTGLFIVNESDLGGFAGAQRSARYWLRCTARERIPHAQHRHRQEWPRALRSRPFQS